MKTIPIALQEHYESGNTTLARLWLITRRDLQQFAFTDHDRELVFDAVTYRPTSSFDASAVSTRSELNVDNLEATGVLDDDGITAEDLEAGLWDGARVELREVNWSDVSMGANVLRVGVLGQVQRRRATFTAELRGLMQKLQNNIGRSVAPTCDAKLGDARCGVDLDALRVSAVVTAVVTERRTFEASALTEPDDWFALGDVTFTGGLNAGRVMEVKTHEADTIELQMAMPYDVEVGDTFDVAPGCDKTKAHCKDKFSNLLNFRGFDFVPGQDAVLLFGGQ